MNFVRSLQKGLSSFWQPLKPYDPDTVVIPEMDQLLTRLENRLDKRCLKRKADTEIDKVERRKRYETGARCGDVPSAPQWEEDAGFGVIKGAGCGGLSPETEGNWREGKREEKEMNGGNADAGEQVKVCGPDASLGDPLPLPFEEQVKRFNAGLADHFPSKPCVGDALDRHKLPPYHPNAILPAFLRKDAEEKAPAKVGKRLLRSENSVPRKRRRIGVATQHHRTMEMQPRKFIVQCLKARKDEKIKEGSAAKVHKYGSIAAQRKLEQLEAQEDECIKIRRSVYYGTEAEVPEVCLPSPNVDKAIKVMPLTWSCSEEEYEPPQPDPPPVEVAPAQQTELKKNDPVANPHDVPLPTVDACEEKKSSQKPQFEIAPPTFGDARKLPGGPGSSFQFSGKSTAQPSVVNKPVNLPMVFGAAATSGSQDTQPSARQPSSFGGLFSPGVQGRAVPEGRKIARAKRNRPKVQSQAAAPPGQMNGFSSGIPGIQGMPDGGSFNFGSNGNGAAAAPGAGAAPFANQTVVFSVPGAPAGSTFGMPQNSNGSGILAGPNGFGNPPPAASMGGQFTGFGMQNQPTQNFTSGNGTHPFNTGNMQSPPGAAFGFGGGSSTINSGNSSGIFAVGTKGSKRPQTAQARARRRRKQENC